MYDSHRGKTRLAKWYAPYSVSAALSQLFETSNQTDISNQDEEKIKLKGEVGYARYTFTSPIAHPSSPLWLCPYFCSIIPLHCFLYRSSPPTYRSTA